MDVLLIERFGEVKIRVLARSEIPSYTSFCFGEYVQYMRSHALGAAGPDKLEYRFRARATPRPSPKPTANTIATDTININLHCKLNVGALLGREGVSDCLGGRPPDILVPAAERRRDAFLPCGVWKWRIGWLTVARVDLYSAES